MTRLVSPRECGVASHRRTSYSALGTGRHLPLLVCQRQDSFGMFCRCHSRSFLVRPFGWGLGTSSPFALRYSLGKTHGMPSRVLHAVSDGRPSNRDASTYHDPQTGLTLSHAFCRGACQSSRIIAAGRSSRPHRHLPGTYFTPAASVAACAAPFSLVRLGRFGARLVARGHGDGDAGMVWMVMRKMSWLVVMRMRRTRGSVVCMVLLLVRAKRASVR